MILSECGAGEGSEIYQELEASNSSRHYDFLRSAVVTSLKVNRPFISTTPLKAFNYHAIACLHTSAGEYRPCAVGVGDHKPPPHYLVPAQMDDFINQVNRAWETAPAMALAAFVLWRLNYIHPFINGNGRTARAASYFVLCVKAQTWFPGDPILPELLRGVNRDEYVAALRHADSSAEKGPVDLAPLHDLMDRLLNEQMGLTPPPPPPPAEPPEAV
jgi:Fic/DOC family